MNACFMIYALFRRVLYAYQLPDIIYTIPYMMKNLFLSGVNFKITASQTK